MIGSCGERGEILGAKSFAYSANSTDYNRVLNPEDVRNQRLELKNKNV